MASGSSTGGPSSNTSTPASNPPAPPPHAHNDVAAFHSVLLASRRMLVLCGAGLSAASGLPTFRGAGGMWRNHDATDLATPGAFSRDPALVWLFYSYRRHAALKASPNNAHFALAELGRKRGEQRFLCLSQNVDGLHLRASHPPSTLRLLHGSLMTVKCWTCSYVVPHDATDPLCPALAPASIDPDDSNPGYIPLLDTAKAVPKIDMSELPQCPLCVAKGRTGRGSLLRPGVVWFGERLPKGMLEEIDEWMATGGGGGEDGTTEKADGKKDHDDNDDDGTGKIDLMLVIGTSAVVHPAAGYIAKARARGAVVCVVNMEAEEEWELRKLRQGTDFAFGGDAAEWVPRLLEPVIGKMVLGKEEGDVRFVMPKSRGKAAREEKKRKGVDGESRRVEEEREAAGDKGTETGTKKGGEASTESEG